MLELLKSRYRTHTCGELREQNIDQDVVLSGWIHRLRDHGGLMFVDLRDNYGVTQLVCQPDPALKIESVISVNGKVVARAEGAKNLKLATGGIEVKVTKMEVLSRAEQLPFQIAEDDNAPETTRLRYRFLELRKEKLHANIILRSQVISKIREIMTKLGFLEFQTPILTSSSPEGARDFLVPSRRYPGKFFALPQAPQQFKQLLMVAGFDRYFQIAPCFRDEDPRADRSPGEFYQCDLEMSFVEVADVFKTCEQLFYQLFTSFTKHPVTSVPFPRIPYREAIECYGSDKPDLRFRGKILDLTEHFVGTTFEVYKNVLNAAGRIRAVMYSPKEIPSRKFFDTLTSSVKERYNTGIGYLIFDGNEFKGSIAKFLSPDNVTAFRKMFESPGIMLIMAGRDEEIVAPLGKLRVEVADQLGLLDKDRYEFCWVTDFPMYERDAETGEVVFSHNPFSMPQGGLDALNSKNPLEILANQYDVVCNGHELSSGAIRNHLPEIMYRAFEIAGYSKSDVDAKFGGMIRAFQFGAPPHGGMAPGIDRIVMLLAGENAIREVIAFPLAQSVEDLLMGAPSEVTEKQLRELHISIRK